MAKALTEAGIVPQQVDYINAHATSTPLGDISELKGISKIFGNHPVAISATKSMTGHLLGAAGAIESIISILSVKEDIIPATMNTQNLDQETPEGLNIILGNPLRKIVNYSLNNTFGFGGHTASSLFKKHAV